MYRGDHRHGQVDPVRGGALRDVRALPGLALEEESGETEPSASVEMSMPEQKLGPSP